MHDLKTMVKGTTVHFLRAHQGNLWYEVRYNVTEAQDAPVAVYDTFEFPVPMDDMGEATFSATDKAMLFMRYIRAHLKTKDAATES